MPTPQKRTSFEESFTQNPIYQILNNLIEKVSQSPLQASGEKTIGKLREQEIIEAHQQGVPLEHIENEIKKSSLGGQFLQAAARQNALGPGYTGILARPTPTMSAEGLLSPEQLAQLVAPQAKQAISSPISSPIPPFIPPPNPSTQNLREPSSSQNVLQDLLNATQQPQGFLEGLFQTPGITPEGKYKPGGVVSGFFGSNINSPEALIQRQKLTGLEPFQKGEQEKLSIEQANRLEQLDREYGYKAQIEAYKAGIDPKNPQVAAQVFSNDLTNFIDAFEAIPIKGRGLGGVSAIGGALGFGREERAKYEQMSEAFVYSFASYIAQQQGRALDRDEVKRFRNIIKLKTGDTKGQIIGKVQSMVDLANSRAKVSGSPLLPNARTLINQIRLKNAGISNISSTQSELDAINRRLQEIGGE